MLRLPDVLKVAVVSSRYPSADAPYNHMFVHTRCRQYRNVGVAVEVLVPARQEGAYIIDGVPVRRLPAPAIARAVADDGYDAVMFHLLHHSMIGDLDGGPIYRAVLAGSIPSLLFVHGIELQRVLNSRPEDINLLRPRSVIRAMYRDFWVFSRMKSTIRRFLAAGSESRFVAVSDWMLRDVEASLGFSIASKAATIPNGIDTTLFRFDDRWPQRDELLTLRPLLLRGKYAVDLAIDAMACLGGRPSRLSLYGRGIEKDKIIDYMNQQGVADRISLHDRFIEHAEIPSIHARHGIYLAVTRMDAQGVSMCEAMASGLPVISFNTCAIPEFITHNDNGFLVEDFDVSEIPSIVDELRSSHSTFSRIAEQGRAAMERIDVRITAERELALVGHVR